MEIFYSTIAAFIGAIIGSLFTYFNKKEENKAIIEDQRKITTEIEDVKKIYNQSLQKVIAKLNVISSQEINYNNEKRIVLINLYNGIVGILDYFTRPTFNLPNEFNSNSYLEERFLMNEKVDSVVYLIGQLQLYFNEEEIISVTTKLNNEINDKLVRLRIEYWKNLFMNTIAIEKAKEQDSNNYSKINELMHKRRELNSNYVNDMLRSAEAIRTIYIDFIDVYRRKIKKLHELNEDKQ